MKKLNFIMPDGMASSMRHFLLLLIGLLPLVLSSCDGLLASRDKPADPRNLLHFRKSIQAFELGVSLYTSKKTATETREKLSQVVRHFQEAIDHAEQVNLKDLNSLSLEASERYNRDFIIGLQLCKEGLSSEEDDLLQAGGLLLIRWDTWYKENIAL